MLDSSVKIGYDAKDLRVLTVNGEPVFDSLDKSTAVKISMTKEERIEGNPDWNPTPKVYSTQGKLQPQDPTLVNFKNDPNDPQSLHSAVMALRGNKHETLYFYNPQGEQTGKAISHSSDQNAVAPDLNDQRRFVRSGGVAVHNHPQIDMTFSGPDFKAWLTTNNQEMMVVSPNFAFSCRYAPDTKVKRPPTGKQNHSDFPAQVMAEYDRAFYDPQKIAETKKLVMQYGWGRTDPVTKVKTKMYGDEGEPSHGLVLKTHGERIVRELAKKYGFIYTKYTLPKEETQ
jgi:hypothetical protein